MFNLFSGAKDKRFTRTAVPLIIIGTLIYYLFVSLIGEQINILTTVLPTETGWDISIVMNAYTIGGLLSVPATFVINTMLMRVSTRKFLIANALILAAGVALMGISVQLLSLVLFSAMFLIIRVFAVCIQMGANYMCTEWWNHNRGKALGFITMGAPIASASFVAIMTGLTSSSLGFTGSYYIFALSLVVLAVIVAIWYRDKPEDVDLYPDGELEPPVQEQLETPTLTIRDILLSPSAWMLIVAFGIINFGNNAMTAFFVTSMVAREVSSSVYLVALSAGALVGIPMSYVLGIIDDKWGTPKASLCLCFLSIVGFLGMAFAGPDNILSIVLACFGYACITGGFPNLMPSMIAHVFGRKNFLGASRIIVSLIAVIASFASQYMAVFLNSGNLKLGYYGLCVGILVAAVLIGIVGRLAARSHSAQREENVG